MLVDSPFCRIALVLVIGSLSVLAGLRTESRQLFLRQLIPGMDQVAPVVAGRASAARPVESTRALEALLSQRMTR